MRNDDLSNNVMPPAAVVRFSFGGADIIRLPVPLFLKFGTRMRKMNTYDSKYSLLAHFGDKVNTLEEIDREESLSYLRQVPWRKIDPYVSVLPIRDALLLICGAEQNAAGTRLNC